MKRLTILILCLSSFVFADEQPNVLFIMSDDHAAHAIGAYGGRLAKLNPTPHIDRIAKEGALLKNCFVINSICTPSRAAILTGQYSHKNGVTTLSGRLPAERQTLAHAMKKAGYHTAMVGKWHLKEEPGAFDYYQVLPGQGSYFNPVFRVQGKEPWPKNEVRMAGYDCKHSSDAITEISLRWLKQRKKWSKKPFFLMHHYKAPHDNFENAERYDWLYEDVDIPEPESLWKRGNHGPIDKPQYGTSVSKRTEWRNMGHHMFVDKSLDDEAYTRTSYQRYLKKFLRCVKGVDDGIGKVLAHLEETGELDNTIVVYTADQGFMLGEHDYIDKRWMYEESLRMPFVVRYPPAIKAGTVVEELCNNTDFLPTLLELAGVKELPPEQQGHSFAPLLKGETIDDWRDATYYRYWLHMTHHDNPAHYGLRTATHKLIFFYGLPLGVEGLNKQKGVIPTPPHWELYDLSLDPKEMNNLYGKSGQEEITAKLKEKLLALKAEIGDTDEAYPELMKVRETAW